MKYDTLKYVFMRYPDVLQLSTTVGPPSMCGNDMLCDPRAKLSAPCPPLRLIGQNIHKADPKIYTT